ncbi:Uncharacterised protein [Streptococcus pneumoniae]|nr:Uncharacterised protein [Streptococcus pneumoniae]COF16717.1 Uncharacterised protein [Streptococcus pneumoniae]
MDFLYCVQNRYFQSIPDLCKDFLYLYSQVLLDSLQHDNPSFDFVHYTLLHSHEQYNDQTLLVYTRFDKFYPLSFHKLFQVFLAFQKLLDLLGTYHKLRRFSLLSGLEPKPYQYLEAMAQQDL